MTYTLYQRLGEAAGISGLADDVKAILYGQKGNIIRV